MAQASVPAPLDGAVPIDPNAAAQAGDWRARLSGFANQPAFRRALPALIALGAVVIIAVLYMMIAQGPQRILYSSLSDGERAKVVEALERGGITYSIDNMTGTLTVAEDDVYRARMLVASDAGLAAPQGASEMLELFPWAQAVRLKASVCVWLVSVN